MKRLILAGWVLVGLFVLNSCSSTQSLQEYYIDNSENPNFLSLDFPVSMLNLDEAELNEGQRQALSSLRKLNVLAFKKTEGNGLEYTAELDKVDAILKKSEYKELMKLKSKYGNGVIKYLGEDDAIEEVVMFGNNAEKGFALVRVLGKDMKPSYLIQLMEVIQKADYDSDALGEIGEFLKS